MKRSLVILPLLLGAGLFALVAAAGAQAPKPKVYTKGTQQMAGSNGLFGQTYTLVSADGFGPVNFTLISAEYSVERISMDQGNLYAPKAGEKLLVIHYRLKNPNTADMYYSSRNLFQAVDSNNNTIQDSGTSRRASATQMVADTMKPGQGIDDLVTYIVIPASASIPKLILQLGRAGSKDLVTRYFLGTPPNVVKPIPAPYADPADKTGDTPLAQVPGTVGTTYSAGYFDFALTSVAVAPGPLGSLTADDGKQFLVATVTATNKSLAPHYYSQTLVPVLVTDDGKITDFSELGANHDDPFQGTQIDPGGTVTERLVLQYPKDNNLKTLSIAEAVDNSGGQSKAIVYDVSGVK